MNVEVKIVPGARKREIRAEGGRLKVKVCAKPVEGKANDELIEYLADAFHVKRRDVKIIAGERDTRKVVSLPVDEQAFAAVLKRLTSV